MEGPSPTLPGVPKDSDVIWGGQTLRSFSREESGDSGRFLLRCNLSWEEALVSRTPGLVGKEGPEVMPSVSG